MFGLCVSSGTKGGCFAILAIIVGISFSYLVSRKPGEKHVTGRFFVFHVLEGESGFECAKKSPLVRFYYVILTTVVTAKTDPHEGHFCRFRAGQSSWIWLFSINIALFNQ